MVVEVLTRKKTGLVTKLTRMAWVKISGVEDSWVGTRFKKLSPRPSSHELNRVKEDEISPSQAKPANQASSPPYEQPLSLRGNTSVK